ncbi:hypothetical protein NEOLEDRAFT_483938 [Neolentinus lepideus HHB14362 ss-1]|uniref:XLF-like N-terminal domain-containing protein n=1 Tax=Neolentinus lepideus HHB14362 ss-1 TaxID=1314782 RepID=A0A165VMC8_9AGAM|nr:hypothetical protein NEOLEDRAFT_483938 [Neolentinus lepideus HHB14362 ss-1]
MDPFIEEHSKCLLEKEWLVKIDSEKSIPYLFKFHHSTADLSSCLLVTDTKTVWAEVLTPKRFAQRWRDANRDSELVCDDPDEEHDWRAYNLDRLSKLHTLVNFADATFTIVESQNADLSVELDCEHFKWRWESYYVGPRTSADVLSKHLIMPLISTMHMAFNSADPVSELSSDDLQKAVDKTGRTARRTVDTHVKNALSSPRVATALQRMTALFNFIPSLPTVSTSAEQIDISTPFQTTNKPKSMDIDSPPQTKAKTSSLRVNLRDSHDPTSASTPAPAQSQDAAKAAQESETESESDEGVVLRAAGKSHAASAVPGDSEPRTSSQARQSRSPAHSQSPAKALASSSDEESLPHRPKKKAKAKTTRDSDASSESESSEEERRKRSAKIVSGGKTQRGGARQPIKRGGRRF